MIIRKTHYLLIFLLIASCGSGLGKKDEKAKDQNEIFEKKRIEPNVFKKLEEEGGGVLDGLRQKNKSTTFEFSTSNPLWRATLSTLDFMPLANVSYSGGTIITDWYSSNNSKESVKLTVQFLSDELKSSSIRVLAHKRICENEMNCKVVSITDEFPNKIKENILSKAIELNIKAQTNKK
jgi:hypothetical protein